MRRARRAASSASRARKTCSSSRPAIPSATSSTFLDELAVCGKQLHNAGFGALADGLNMVLSRENLHDEDRFRRGLAQRFGDSVRLLEAIGAVSAIGAGINTSYKNVRLGSAALAAAGIESCGLSTSSFRISWLLPDATVPDAVRALHRAFIEEAAQPVP